MRRILATLLFCVCAIAQDQAHIITIIPAPDLSAVGELRLRDVQTTTHYVGFKPAPNITANVMWQLPSADSAGCLNSNGSGVISIGGCGFSVPLILNGTATPTAAQLQITTAGVSGFGMLDYSVDNVQLLFDQMWTGSDMVARSANIARIVKDGQHLYFAGSRGNTPGSGGHNDAPQVSLDLGSAAWELNQGPLVLKNGTAASGTRWSLGRVNAESGSNVGSDLYLARYDDSGALLNYPLTFTRSTGDLTVSANLNPNGSVALGNSGAGWAIAYIGTTNTQNLMLVNGSFVSSKKIALDGSSNLAIVDIATSTTIATFSNTAFIPTITTPNVNVTGQSQLHNAVITGTCTVNGVACGTGGGGGSGTVTSVATSFPISGGTFTTSGTISCPQCVDTVNNQTIAGTKTFTADIFGNVNLGSTGTPFTSVNTTLVSTPQVNFLYSGGAAHMTIVASAAHLLIRDGIGTTLGDFSNIAFIAMAAFPTVNATTGYLANGSTGVTSSTCSSFKFGLCIAP
jgi:hypothetical protein